MRIVRFALNTATQLAFFSAIGCASGLAYFVTLYVLVDLVSLNYLIGVSIGYVAALTSHFILNKILFFGHGKKVNTRQVFRYLQLCAMNYFLTIASVFAAVEYYDLSHYLAALCALFLTTPVGFVIMKIYVFSKPLSDKNSCETIKP